MDKVFCDLCDVEIQNDEEYKFSISRQPTSRAKNYYVSWDLCQRCKDALIESWEKEQHAMSNVTTKKHSWKKI